MAVMPCQVMQSGDGLQLYGNGSAVIFVDLAVWCNDVASLGKLMQVRGESKATMATSAAVASQLQPLWDLECQTPALAAEADMLDDDEPVIALVAAVGSICQSAGPIQSAVRMLLGLCDAHSAYDDSADWVYEWDLCMNLPAGCPTIVLPQLVACGLLASRDGELGLEFALRRSGVDVDVVFAGAEPVTIASLPPSYGAKVVGIWLA